MKLFEPWRLRDVDFPNRTVLAPMVLNWAEEDGRATQPLIDFYQARARAGVGYLVLGATFVHPAGRGFSRQTGLAEDRHVDGLGRLTAAVRGEGARLGVQLSFKNLGRPPESFDLAELAEIRRAFGRAAERARRAGCDAVELHACHDYLLNHFLSPVFNHRQDNYGGSLENRFRLLSEAVAAVRDQVGQDLLLGVRLSLDDFLQDGLGLVETLEVGSRLAQAGVDYLHGSVGVGLSHYRISPPAEIRRGANLDLAGALQSAVPAPVIGVGRLDRPAVFRAAVESDQVSLAAAGRALIADAEFVAKIREGREAEIRPCLACNFCLARIQKNEPLRCAVNPWVGREGQAVARLTRPLKVLVQGGGPAGLTAAAVAAGRGAQVRLVEKTGRLGGALRVAGRPPHKESLTELAEYLIAAARRAGASLETEAEPGPAELAGYDRIIIATGAEPIRLDLPGLDGPLVLSPEEILVREELEPGAYLVVGGGLVGLEVADYLVQRGREAVLIEMTAEFGQGLAPMRARLIQERLIRAGANLIPRARLTAVEGDLARVDLAGRSVRLGPFRGIIPCVGYRGRSGPAETTGTKAILIGDAKAARSVFEATQEGCQAALDLG